MLDDTWYSRALPILQFLARTEDHDLVSIGDISEATGIEGQAVVSEVERLISSGYVRSTLRKMMTGGDVSPWFLEGTKIAERGARVVGMWPAEDRYDALLRLLDRQIEAESDPTTKTGLGRLKDSLVGVGAATGTALLTAWLQGLAGLH